jgi:anti-sigma factor RsiW
MTAEPPDRPTSADPGREDIVCQDFVELVTDYLDGALPIDVRARVDEHLATCDGCQNVLAQWRTIIALAGRLTEADVDNTDEITRDRLISTLRGLRRR